MIHLYIFDNGGHYHGGREDKYGRFSRALQYKIDLNQLKEIILCIIQIHILFREGLFLSLIGNWLINWSRGIQTVTEISKNNDIELEFNFNEWFRYA